ncbi:uncharacterized protein LOC116775644 isoform X2 [Danaus plexippus]|uniref:uncharacterized protein LOC116775644 isoform X2 n=1 Tax=Danaus plexippus TaxID=13037 RepID=UPI002AAFAB99|nr:uncharacterized protein LOC116775644 isoform X2 [Danaus plexippus]
MKFLYIFVVCLAVVLAAPAPDQDQQDQSRRRLRFRIADSEPVKFGQRNDRSRYRNDDYNYNYLRKIAQGKASPYQVRDNNQQSYYDLGSLQFRYQPAPYQPSSANSQYDDRDAYLVTPNLNYYRGSYLRDDQYRIDDDDDDDDRRD